MKPTIFFQLVFGKINLQFLRILVAINATIDGIFSQFGVNATDLTRRAENALNRAQDAK